MRTAAAATAVRPLALALAITAAVLVRPAMGAWVCC